MSHRLRRVAAVPNWPSFSGTARYVGTSANTRDRTAQIPATHLDIDSIPPLVCKFARHPAASQASDACTLAFLSAPQQLPD